MGRIVQYRQTYFGRNLVVQAMCFGRLRYWFYSLHMPTEIVAMVQRDADTLWWAREPDLHQTRRIRRWVAQRSAIGPRNKGGLNVMNWSDHVDSFYAQWFVRYLHPGNSSWKDLVDHILLHNPGTGELIYPEGRGILLANLTPAKENRMIARIPAKATYLRACLRAFWELGLRFLQHQSFSLHASVQDRMHGSKFLAMWACPCVHALKKLVHLGPGKSIHKEIRHSTDPKAGVIVKRKG